MVSSKQVTLLLVEDDDVDRMSFQRGLRGLRISNPVVEAHDADEAMNILRGVNGYEKLRQPYVIILDISLPGKTGLDLLEELRGDPELKEAIVFIFTASSDKNDVRVAQSLNPAGYILKKEAGDSFRSALDLLDHYVRIVELPGS